MRRPRLLGMTLALASISPDVAEEHELFVQRGYGATTVPDIAEAAGVSTRTIFVYFPSKEDIPGGR
jgi:AcrR family transcriptional regulator